MEKLLYVAAGVALVGLAWLGVLVLKHGWGWVLAWYHARVARAEAAVKAQAAAADAALTIKLKGLLDPLNTRLVVLEQKAGLAPQSAAVAAAAPAAAPIAKT